MKAIVAVIFSVLLALAVAAGAYFGFSNYRNTRAIIRHRDSLQAEIATLETKIRAYNPELENETSTLRASLDNLCISTTESRRNLKGCFLDRGTLYRNPKVELSESQDTASWRSYYFNLEIEGSREAVDSYLVNLYRELRFVNFDEFKVAVAGKKIRLETQGRVSTPKEFE